MKKAFAAILITSLCSTLGFSAEISTKQKVNDAVGAAQSWLAVVDSGEYLKSWGETGNLFQSQLSDSQWTNALNNARKPLGKKISRKETSADYKTSLPGVPDGEYVVIVFQSNFENKKNAIETVTVVFEKNQWRVIGYFIK